MGNSPFYEESDSAIEMDHITQSFKKTTTAPNVVPTQATTSAGQQGNETDPTGHSRQDTTLLEIKRQAQEANTAKSKKRKGNKRLTRRRIPMREEIRWTRSFISGPAYRLHNPHMVWCHVCKKKVSIKSKGPYEILRHHRTERHPRRDERWRYEQLKSVDPITGKVQHRVRGGHGKILTNMKLTNELPKFIHSELVDIGERFHFYEDFIKGS